MSSKKKRKKLKEQYNPKNKIGYNFFYKDYFHDRDLILEYFKNNPNIKITCQELINNINLEFDTSSSVSKTIKAINNYTNYHIESKTGYGGGYIYYA